MSYKSKYTLQERLIQTNTALHKYPDKVPIICEKNTKSKNTVDIDKTKYLVPYDFTVGQFMYIIRKRLCIPPEVGLYFFVNGNIPASSNTLAYMYHVHKDEDGYLYITYSMENTFG